MSQADNSYDPKEMATIKGKMNKLFSKDTDLEKKLYATIRQYNSFDKSKLSELFESSIKHFGHQSPDQLEIYTDLYDIIQADGKVQQAETRSLETLKKIIEHQRDGDE